MSCVKNVVLWAPRLSVSLCVVVLAATMWPHIEVGTLCFLTLNEITNFQMLLLLQPGCFRRVCGEYHEDRTQHLQKFLIKVALCQELLVVLLGLAWVIWNVCNQQHINSLGILCLSLSGKVVGIVQILGWHHILVEEPPQTTNSLIDPFVPIPTTGRLTTLSTECSICLELGSAQGFQLDCGHTYHQHCITTWIQTQDSEAATCPMCREPCQANDMRSPGYKLQHS